MACCLSIRALKVFALQHLLQSHAAVETNHFFVIHLAKPIAVEDRFRPRRVENLERLFAISLRVVP